MAFVGAGHGWSGTTTSQDNRRRLHRGFFLVRLILVPTLDIFDLESRRSGAEGERVWEGEKEKAGTSLRKKLGGESLHPQQTKPQFFRNPLL